MARRRRRYGRKPDLRRGRKREPPPTTGWLRKELVQLVPIAPSTITTYIRRRLLPAAQFRGTATRYQRIHLLLLLAIRQYRMNGLTDLSTIKQRLDRMTPHELEAWVLARSVPKAAALALAPLPTKPDTSVPLTTTAVQATGAGTEQAPASNAVTSVTATTSISSWTANAPTPSPTPQDEDITLLAVTWQHVQLAPGVIVTWRTDAPVASKRVVQRLMKSAAEG